jgi:tetratricopeptide (TPR) repeat protein
MIAMIPEEPKRRQAVEWVERGNELYEGGYYEDAIELFGRALESDPGFPKAWYNKGVALDKLERYDEALECYERTLEIRARPLRCLG